jgi:predicted nucleotidyltransferase
MSPKTFATAKLQGVLFGSRAQGDAKPESDVDLLVLIRVLPRNCFERYRGLSAWRERCPTNPPARLP